MMELLAALSMGVLVLGSAYAVSTSSNRTFMQQINISRLQNGLRTVERMLRSDLNKAGAQGVRSYATSKRCLSSEWSAGVTGETPRPENIRSVYLQKNWFMLNDSANPSYTDNFIVGANSVKLAEQNAVNADKLTVVGAFRSDDSFLIQSIVNINGFSSKLILDSNSHSFQKLLSQYINPDDSASVRNQAAIQRMISPDNVTIAGDGTVANANDETRATFGIVQSSERFNMAVRLLDAGYDAGTDTFFVVTTSLPVGKECLPGSGQGSFLSVMSGVEYYINANNTVTPSNMITQLVRRPIRAGAVFEDVDFAQVNLSYSLDAGTPAQQKIEEGAIHFEVNIGNCIGASQCNDRREHKYPAMLLANNPERVDQFRISLFSRDSRPIQGESWGGPRDPVVEPLRRFLYGYDGDTPLVSTVRGNDGISIVLRNVARK